MLETYFRFGFQMGLMLEIGLVSFGRIVGQNPNYYFLTQARRVPVWKQPRVPWNQSITRGPPHSAIPSLPEPAAAGRCSADAGDATGGRARLAAPKPYRGRAPCRGGLHGEPRPRAWPRATGPRALRRSAAAVFTPRAALGQAAPRARLLPLPRAAGLSRNMEPIWRRRRRRSGWTDRRLCVWFCFGSEPAAFGASSGGSSTH